MELKRVNRVLKFKQSDFMAPYINFNTKLRAGAKNDFEKDLFKLMNNSVFGKTMENVRQYRDIELVTDKDRLVKLMADPRLKSRSIFTPELVAVHREKANAELRKPISVGCSVLDLSKLLMYQFHYCYIVPKYGAKAKLLFTDTDSLCYLVETEDIYEDMGGDGDRFDFSDYPKEHKLFSTINKKVIGKMKDETAGVPIVEFVGLRSKMYSIIYAGKEKKTAKGVKKVVVKKDIRHRDYLRTLQNCSQMHHKMVLFRTKKHVVKTIVLKKISLSAYDDKRYLLGDGKSSLAYGHYRIGKE